MNKRNNKGCRRTPDEQQQKGAPIPSWKGQGEEIVSQKSLETCSHGGGASDRSYSLGGTRPFPGRRRRDMDISREEGEEGRSHFQGGGGRGTHSFSGRRGRRDVAISREKGEEGHGQGGGEEGRTHFQAGGGGGTRPFSGRRGRRDALIFREEGRSYFQEGGGGGTWPFSGRRERSNVAIFREDGEEGRGHFQGGRGGGTYPFSGRKRRQGRSFLLPLFCAHVHASRRGSPYLPLLLPAHWSPISAGALAAPSQKPTAREPR